MAFAEKLSLNTLQNWFRFFSSRSPAGATTEGQTGCEDLYVSLLGQ
jgi:hypothetical protein